MIQNLGLYSVGCYLASIIGIVRKTVNLKHVYSRETTNKNTHKDKTNSKKSSLAFLSLSSTVSPCILIH
jgi:hypothetical protein